MIPLAMFGLGVPELLIILAVVLLLFGGSRLAGLGKSTGRALKEFKEETKGIKGSDTPSVGQPGVNPYQTEAGSTFVPTQQGSPYVNPPQNGAPYVQPPQNGAPYVQPPQNGAPYVQPPQQDPGAYQVPPQNGQPNGSPYGQPPQGGAAEHDLRRDV